jgi:adenylate cyclase
MIEPILLVEDDGATTEELREGLHADGISCLVENGVSRALQTLDEHPDTCIVVSDIGLREGTGIDLLSALKSRTDRHFEVVLITGHGGAKEAIQALRLGAHDFLQKPCDIEYLCEVVRRAQQHVTSRQAAAAAETALQSTNEQLSLKNKQIKALLGRYVDGDVAREFLLSPESQRLGGQRAKVTVLVSDLRGFTALSEKLPPEEVVVLLNNYLGEMINVVHQYGGTVDNIIGDALMAVFGAPENRADDAMRAVACAVEMQRCMQTVNYKNRCIGVGDIQMGVGINTGEVVVGNIGSEAHAKYSVIGSPVNRAWRIESFTLGGQVLASRATIEELQPTVVTGGTLRVKLRGVDEPVEIFDIRGVGDPYGVHLPEIAPVSLVHFGPSAGAYVN